MERAFKSQVDADPLTWDDIYLENEHPEILVTEEKSKTRTIRYAPLGDFNINLRNLLIYSKNQGHDLITTKNFKENWRAIVRLSGLSFEGSEADRPRRSFATYLYSKDRNLADRELSRIMGNSPYVLNKHYKSVIKSGEGKKYFSIGPTGKFLPKSKLLSEKEKLMSLWTKQFTSYTQSANKIIVPPENRILR